MINDPIADMLTRIRNAIQQKHRFVDVNRSKLILTLLSVLKETGFICNYVENPEERQIRVFLKYKENRESLINGLKRESTPGRRYYVNWKRIPIVRRGIGTAIVSTSKGVLSGTEARKQKIGGELICTVW